MLFALDTPTDRNIPSIARFSGWCMDKDGCPAKRVRLLVDGIARFETSRSERTDVEHAYPSLHSARYSGFVGDVDLNGRVTATISIEVELESGPRIAQENTFTVIKHVAYQERQRSYDLDTVLRDSGKTIAGARHFHVWPTLPTLRVLEDGHTHPFGAQSRALINALGQSQVFLDFGSGIKSSTDLLPNGIFVDVIQFPNTDIVSTRPDLPFRDESIDLIISQAVFEHIPDPFRTAQEFHRVLKRGGSAFIDVAFMQPFHADPHHYFNMTEEGLRRVLVEFRDVRVSIQHYQTPQWGLRMQLDAVLPHMTPGEWRNRLLLLNAQLRENGDQLDEDLGACGRARLAAGYSALATKR